MCVHMLSAGVAYRVAVSLSRGLACREVWRREACGPGPSWCSPTAAAACCCCC